MTVSGGAPVLAADLPANPDVVIVGAGAAGLAAGRELRRRGVSFVIVEAANRVGGRAWTESESFGAPVDHGCSWISGSDKNVFTAFGREAGFTLVDHSNADVDLFDLDGARADDADWAAFDRAWDAIEREFDRAGRAGRDVPASTIMPDVPWGATIKSWMGAMDYGVRFDELSTAGHWNTIDSQPSFIVREGLGALVATLADGLPISLGTRVTSVDWSGTGVRVETTKGTIAAKACLLTVATGVLNADAIAFTPKLPDWKREAAANIPMGLLMKVPLLFDGARLGLGENNWVTYRIPEDREGEACYFVAWPCGHDYLFGNIGGPFAWELYAEGQAAVVDYALEALVRLVGSDARKHFVRGFTTDWADNPLTYGAYGSVRPGAWGAREALATPLADRLFFAGEATGGDRCALVDGAHESGRKTAVALARAIS
ncbi:flavin monoamine oxidase family protein [Ovoidimarina sediminis]|uniref:flavin monoamine oxidase family protein n=1 Tax=Ovoidimarina sediminis TaxID=3079856 RepID=UPI002909F7C3|nr:NAD(P)/FAD-dependent oxidoreductase [Rhodophyticola sp. MJ-SS7]MDU8943645.1 NAD(P)/FAD-dependent oxidoreductase [Rhodophyticola sp. MJ-SS7]